MVEKGGFASAYLNRWQLQAIEDLAAEAGLTRFYYVQRLLLEHCIEREKLPSVDLERAVEKWERRQGKPHGNSKEARNSVKARPQARLRKESTQESDTLGAPASAPARKAKLRAARRAKLRNQMVS
jgi:hypothetical protein